MAPARGIAGGGAPARRALLLVLAAAALACFVRAQEVAPASSAPAEQLLAAAPGKNASTNVTGARRPVGWCARSCDMAACNAALLCMRVMGTA